MHEKGAYLRRIVVRVEQSIFAAGAMVTSIERLALAPAPASGNDTAIIGMGFRYEVGAVRNQLGIHAKNTLERLFQLLRRIVRCLQSKDRGAYEMLQSGDIAGDSLADGELHDGGASS